MKLVSWLTPLRRKDTRRRAYQWCRHRPLLSPSRQTATLSHVECLEQRALLTAPNPLALGTLDLSNAAVPDGFRVEGVAASTRTGLSVSGVGDVNGDGFEDVVVGAPTISGPGQAYVVFGSSATFAPAISVDSLDGTNGLRLNGISGTATSIGTAVSGIGDINGDGIGDLAIASYAANASAGSVWVVFGQATFAASVDVASLNGTNGFRLNGSGNEEAGTDVAAAGDVNGDGLDDLIIGAPSPLDNTTGSAYVVFGKTGGFGSQMSLSTLNGSDGFALTSGLNGYAGKSVASGDINGDGFSDVIIGEPYTQGRTWVVFGHDGPFAASIDLETLNSQDGFSISGQYIGQSVDSLGDINGDGFDDLIAGSGYTRYSEADYAYSGEAYVVFGGSAAVTSPLDVATLNGTNGFVIPGVRPGDYLGTEVSSAGDINGDGLNDILIGVSRADYSPDVFGTGRSYVVFGRTAAFPAEINLRVPDDPDPDPTAFLDGVNGFRLDGATAGDQAGYSVSSAGDVNGDGFDDLLVGAPDVTVNGKTSAGTTYVVYGDAFNAQNETQIGTDPGASQSDTLNADGGASTIDRLIGGLGADILNADGGNDVLIGGAGDDTLGLATSVLTFPFRFVGGTGHDTLQLGGVTAFSGNLDLTAIPDSRFVDIEQIDLRGAGANTLTLDVLEVINLSSTTNQLLVRRDSNDTVTTGSGWTAAGTATIDGVNYDRLTQGHASLLLEVPAAVSIAVSPAGVSEAGGTGLVYTITRTNSSGDVTVNFSVAGSSTHLTDYTVTGADSFSASAGTATIAAGQTTTTVTLTPVNDTIVEGSEDITLTLTSATGYEIGVPSAATGTITDNDTAVLSFAAASSNPSESAGTANVSVSLVITANGVASSGTLGSAITVDVDTTGGTATSSDFTFTDPTPLTFAAGAASSSKNASITLTNDTIVEGDESITLALNSLSSTLDGSVSINTSADDHTVTIADNDTAVLAFAAGSSNPSESAGTHQVSVGLLITANGVANSGTLGSALTVDVDTTGGTATSSDFTFTDPTPLTFAAGAASSSQNASITLSNDTIVEGNETIILALNGLSSTLNGQASVSTSANDHTVTIADNDTAVFAFTSASSNPAESAGNQDVTVSLVITANGVASSGTLGSAITVDVDTTGGTASSSDYTLTDPTPLTFAAGAASGSQNAVVSLTNDTIVEGDETIPLALNGLSSTLDGQVAVNTAADDHTVTIADNDTAVFSFASASSNPAESDGTHQVSVDLVITANGVANSGTLGSALTVDVDTTGGTATGSDFTFTDPTPLTFAAGEASSSKNASITLTNDTIVERNETITLALNGLSSTLNGQAAVNTSADDHTVTIADNDTAVLAFASASSNPAESSGSHDVTVSLVITANGVASSGTLGSAITVDVDTTGGTASSSDYTLTDPTPLTFAAGASSSSQNATLSLTDDTIVEGDETITLALNGLSTTLDGTVSINADADDHTVTIADNDSAVIAFDQTASSAAESDGTHSLAVSLTVTANGVAGSGTLAAAVSVDVVDSQNGTAANTDYTFAGPSSLTFTGASESKTVSVTIADDPDEESDETIALSLSGLSSSLSGQLVLAQPGDAHTVTITDDDGIPPAMLQTELRITQQATATDADGEAAALPDNALFLDEWDEFFLEVWGRITGVPDGVDTAHIEIPYRSDYYTVDAIDPGTSFAGSLTSNVDTSPDNGRITLDVDTTRTDAGINGFVLFARIALSVDLELANDAVNAYITPTVDDRFIAENITATIHGGTAAAPLPVSRLTAEIWPVMYDLDDNGSIGFGDLPAFAALFGASTSSNSEAFRADFDRGGSVSFGDVTLFAGNIGRSRDNLGEQTYHSDFPLDWRPALFAESFLSPASQIPDAANLSNAADSISLLRDVAVDQFEAAGLDPSTADRLRDTAIVVRDLPASLLGVVENGTVVLDVDATGAGWFIDTTPQSDSEFLPSATNSAATGRFDLLTVIAHELGHVLGLSHDDHDDGLMQHSLATGVRREPDVHDIDAFYLSLNELHADLP